MTDVEQKIEEIKKRRAFMPEFEQAMLHRGEFLVDKGKGDKEYSISFDDGTYFLFTKEEMADAILYGACLTSLRTRVPLVEILSKFTTEEIK